MRLAPVLVLSLVGCSEYAFDQKEPLSNGPDLLVEPTSISFGVVELGETSSKGFKLTNIGDEPLEFGELALSGSPSFAMTEAASLSVLEPGASVEGSVVYLPATAPEFGQIQIPSTDASEPVATIDLMGELGIPGLLIDPMSIDFGLVDVGTEVSAQVTITNDGQGPANLTAAAVDEAVFTVPSFSATVLNPGESTTFDVRFLPPEPLRYDGLLSVTVAELGDAPITLTGTGAASPDAVCDVDPAQAVLTVDEVTWLGSGSSDPGGRALTYDWRIVSAPPGSRATLAGDPAVADWGGFVPDVEGSYTAELTVTNDIGRVDTCQVSMEAQDSKPTAVCSANPNPAEAVRDTVTLSGNGSSDPFGRPLQYTWTLVSSPAGSAVTINGATNNNPDRQFVPDMVGTYTAELVVTNDLGVDSDPCVVDVDAIPAADLWIEMFWTHSGDDMDLHVVRGGQRADLNSGMDCYYGNCINGGLSWAPAGPDGDPRLDLDDIRARGPENVNIDAPANVLYGIYVHDFPSSAYQAANDVTVNVYIGGFLVWTDTRAISGEGNYVRFGDVDWANQVVIP